jgi:hypothetical protein
MFSIIFFMHLPVVRTHTPNGGRWITKVTRHLHRKNIISIKEILLASKNKDQKRILLEWKGRRKGRKEGTKMEGTKAGRKDAGRN